MGWITGILEALKEISGISQLIARYFPPKTEAQKEQDAKDKVQSEEKKIETSGRA